MAGSHSSFNFMARKRTAREGPLPTDILNHVLKYLPLRDAVRTSILSKDWRYKWLTIPYLVFDENFENSLPGKYKPESTINRVLAHQKGPIIKFTFTCSHVDDSVIKIWMKLLSDHPIEDFTLSGDCSYQLEKVPIHLFSFDCLKHLNLFRVKLRLPPVFKGFSRLLTLYLEEVKTDSENFNMFVSKCPALEILHMMECYGKPISFVIDAPSLKSFNFSGIFESFVFENMNIEEVSIDGCNHDDVYYDDDGGGGGGGDDVGRGDGLLPVNESNLINFLGQLPSVRKLAFDGGFQMFLAKGGVLDKLPNYLNHMTTLEFFDFHFEVMDRVTCLLCLMRSSPNLQSLDIRIDHVYSGAIPNSMEAPVIEYLNALEKCDVSLCHNIKNITMNGFKGLKAEMAFVKVVLLKSILLKKLIVKFPSKHAPENVTEVVKGLAGFRRASSEAVIEFG